MINVSCTPRYAGVRISGDHDDLYILYDAIHAIVGDEDEFVQYQDTRIRALALCYDLRHAFMGDREIECVLNHMDDMRMKWHETITPETNVHYAVNVLWPELLFEMMALNDFVNLYAQKQAKQSYQYLLDKANIWDGNIAAVRLFQARVSQCLQETLSEAAFKRLMGLYTSYSASSRDYATHYVDLLNLRFLEMAPEKRQKSIQIMGKRLMEKGREYQDLYNTLQRSARYHRVSMSMLDPGYEYPEEIDW